MNDLYPLRLRPLYKEKIWGGRSLGALLSKALPEGLIGESWEVGDDSVVIEGHLAGATLADLTARYGAQLIGSPGVRRNDGFPLLVKFIDAQDRLSVQVHPDDDYAQKEGSLRGKTEAWYVLAAGADSEIIHGFRDPQLSRERLAVLAHRGDLPDHLEHVAVAAGDVIFIPAGTVHAMGSGLVICEVQQHCDITYRLFDWGRLGDDGRPRELHTEKAVAVSRHSPRQHKITPVELTGAFGRRSMLVACRYFAMELLELSSAYRTATAGRSFVALSTLEGAGEIVSGGTSTAVKPGESVIIPASLGEYDLRPVGSWRVLLAYVPDLMLDIVEPLMAQGVSMRDIVALGGDPATNDLANVALR